MKNESIEVILNSLKLSSLKKYENQTVQHCIDDKVFCTYNILQSNKEMKFLVKIVDIVSLIIIEFCNF